MTLVNPHLALLINESSPLSPHQAYEAFLTDQFVPNHAQRVSFGFTSSEVWAAMSIVVPSLTRSASDSNTHSTIVQPGIVRVLKIDNAWLDTIDVYFFKSGELIRKASIGDTQTIEHRTYNSRMPAIEHHFSPGITEVLIRVAAEDPVTIPVYMGSPAQMEKQSLINAYFYGALYGALIILFVYNVMLFFYLKEPRYILYSFYLLAFSLFNFTYTGHGYWWLWGHIPYVQQWLMPTLMYCYITAGLTFTISYLEAKVYLPRLYALRPALYIGLAVFAIIMLVNGSQAFAVMAQLVFLTTLSVWMLLIGLCAYKNGNVLAKFFVPAIALGTGGATVSSLATWGVIPYSQWAFRAIEIGLLCEMSLLSISLGFNVKQVQDAKVIAETSARIDPLTNLYNRRAFTQLVLPLWELGKRNQQSMAVLLIDLDWFKQINDEFGHDVGDTVLERVAQQIKLRVRSSDLLFRWGGEEFLVFLSNADINEALLLAETLRREVAQMIVSKSVKVTMSVGVASALATKIDLEGLIKHADEALYKAKKGGRNCVVAVPFLQR
jgi:diguanylate cyclase (GGDEF)-like protein